MEARSVGDIPEGELAGIVFGDHPFRHMLISAAGIVTNPEIHLAVPSSALGEAKASTTPGDIDAILIPPGSPHLASAFELKRIKVQRYTFATGTPGKLPEIAKAVRQANGLVATGFHRVILAFIVVTDGRERDEYNFAFRGATNDLLIQIDNAIPVSEADPHIGVFRFELVQPVDKDITLSGGLTGKAHQIGGLRDQSTALTNALIQYCRGTSET